MLLHAYARGSEFTRNAAPQVFLVSLNNSWFSPPNIADALRKSARQTARLITVLVDLPAVHNYHALSDAPFAGSTLQRSWSHQRRDTRRRLSRGISLSEVRVETLAWDKIRESPSFRVWYRDFRRLFRLSAEFKQRVLAETVRPLSRLHTFLRLSFDEIQPLPSQQMVAARFFLEEAAFLCAAPALLAAPQIVVRYHRRMELLEEVLDGRYTGMEIGNVGLSVLDS